MSNLISNIQREAIKEIQKMNADKGYKGSDMNTACYVAESLGSFSKTVEYLITRKTYQEKLRTALPNVALNVNITWDGLITVHYTGCEVFIEAGLDKKWHRSFGGGLTFEEACEDYYNIIQEKTIRFGSDNEIFFSA